MTRLVTVSALQANYGSDVQANIEKTEKFIRQAASKGAQIILPSELFETIYFCTSQDERWFERAHPVVEHPTINHFRKVAQSLGVVLPISFFERDGPHYFNSVAVIDADGELLGVYRKSHIPDGPGYQEKYYFRPGDTGYKVWITRFAIIGIGICWDQWFPECARAMALKGAELLFYPTAIGSEPHNPDLDTKDPWQRAMQGHAVSNAIPVIAANRVGNEENLGAIQNYYGSSFIADHRGNILSSLDRKEQGLITAVVDLDNIKTYRAAWGFFRDRRTDLL